MTFYSSIIVLLFVVSSCSTKNTRNVADIHKNSVVNKQDSLIVFYIYGELAPSNYLNEDDSCTYDFGFQLKRIANCDINFNTDSINDLNAKNYHLMNTKYGNNWQINFEQQTNKKLNINF